MKHQTLPVKRNPVSKGVFKRLSAVTRSRKQRVAATADDDLEHDDHSSKISRALTIIFLIHIVVIGLIFFHQRFLDNGAETGTTAKKVEATRPVTSDRPLPKLSTGGATHIVGQGDNYAIIAKKRDVEEIDLREANDNVVIVPGLILNVPPKRIVAATPPEVLAIRESTPIDRDRGLVEAVPVETAGAPRAQLVRLPERPHATATPVARNESAPIPSGKTYTVQAGDNIWRIANRFKVDQKALMKANGISDPKKLKLGMSLNIPR